MKALRRQTIFLTLWGSILIAGCSFPQSLYFIMPEAKDPAELKRLASEDKKEVKVVLWTYMALDPREEFIQADRLLAVKLADEIHRISEENKEKVTIEKPNLVEQYKSRHPNWQALELTQVGHDFNADYVINLEIDKLSLYEPKAYQQIYRGQTEIQVSVLDMQHPDDLQSKEFTDRYPADARGDMTPFEITQHAFRDKFLEHVAKRLAFYFVEHKRRTKMVDMDD
ncbi:MAG TPA: hypothetical protein VMF69_04685 [Gemmataceae bacterium]|nr:hypothetical protein [Gemmataceae bacterium]